MRIYTGYVVTATGRSFRGIGRCCKSCVGRRSIQIATTPTGISPAIDSPSAGTSLSSNAGTPDAQFEVLGSPFSLLSVSLSASQNLYTRRGTLIGLTGKAENVTSTLSILEPFRRAVLGIPFFYQKISSTSPLTALVSTKSSITSMAVVHLDGTTDWMVAQRQALLAWSGHSLRISPTINRMMSLAHWGDSQVTGRGLLALVGKGQIYQITLKDGEEYVAHPSNVVAYTVTQHPPLPYRLKSSVLRLQIPHLGVSRIIPDTKFFRVMRESNTLKIMKQLLFTFRTWSRRTIFGDRLFLNFYGPTTVLLQTRAARFSDVLTTRDVNEIAETEPGLVNKAVTLSTGSITENARQKELPQPASANSNRPTKMSFASVGQDGKVKFE